MLLSMKKTIFLLGLAAASLGILWLLQGLGVIDMKPILCFANCDPVQGASATWAVIGAVTLAVGATAIFLSLKSRPC
jgi:hypothetical protein